MGKSIVQESKDNVKKKQQKQKENTEMKNIKSNGTLRTVGTIIVTLLMVAAFAFTYIKGMEAGANQQKSVNDRISAQVKEVVSAIHMEPSKESQ